MLHTQARGQGGNGNGPVSREPQTAIGDATRTRVVMMEADAEEADGIVEEGE